MCVVVGVVAGTDAVPDAEENANEALFQSPERKNEFFGRIYVGPERELGSMARVSQVP